MDSRSQDSVALARPENVSSLPAMTLKSPFVVIVVVLSSNVSFGIYQEKNIVFIIERVT